MRSSAKMVEAYFAELPEDRREAIEQVRRVILDNLPDGIEEAMNWGMIACLRSRSGSSEKAQSAFSCKRTKRAAMAVYLTSIYMDAGAQHQFEQEYRATGKRYDVSRSCVRFRRLDDLPLDLIGRAIGSMTVDEFVAKERDIRNSGRRNGRSAAHVRAR